MQEEITFAKEWRLCKETLLAIKAKAALEYSCSSVLSNSAILHIDTFASCFQQCQCRFQSAENSMAIVHPVSSDAIYGPHTHAH